MRNLLPIIIPAMLLGACDRQEDAPNAGSSPTAAALPSASVPTEAARREEPRWTAPPDAKGAALHLQTQTSGRIVSLTCASAENRLQISVPGFTPIGSEERLSFGSGGEVEALVADFRGDRRLGGVSAGGAVPANLAALIGGPISVSYGAQTSGPHPAVPPDIARSFVAACRTRASADGSVNPCLVQDGKPLSPQPLRAIGTEPFWAARIEGRCITYSHPEDQKGIRVWTRFTPTPDGGVWSGALGGRRFELRTRAAPGCSDGMSDNTYPVAVDLLVQGDQRRGCAQPM